MYCKFAEFFELMINRQIDRIDPLWPPNHSDQVLDMLKNHRNKCKKCLDDHLDRMSIVDPHKLDPYMSMTESYWLHSQGLEIVDPKDLV